MRAYIKKLQEKDDDKKKQILFWFMFCSMSIVIFIWIYGLGVRFTKPSLKEQTKEDMKPFKIFSNSISDAIKGVGASVIKAPSLKNETSINENVSNDDLIKEGEKQVDLIPVEHTN